MNRILALEEVSKAFGETKVLRNINLSVAQGEFITLLGSSGCGKTTTLRIIAGLETADTGKVSLDGVEVTDFEPNKRDVNTVFQNYALFPHMNVENNIGYALKLKKVGKAEIAQRVEKMLTMVQLEGYGKRMPGELSGGQRQRVAIARSLINQPKLLLLDEPLGALDLQLRHQMQIELKRLQKQLGITFIYITHDQEEALNMSDRIAVMREGAFEQIGTPDEIYHHPKTSYVASFVGSANIIKGVVESVTEGSVVVKNSSGYCRVSTPLSWTVGQEITLAVRGEELLLQASPMELGLGATITEINFIGNMLRITMKLEDGTQVTASQHGLTTDFKEGEMVYFTFPPKSGMVVDLEHGDEE